MSLLNPPRRMGFELWVALFMAGAAGVFAVQPTSPIFVWIETTYHFQFVPTWLGGSLFIGGYGLAWVRHCGRVLFFVLTAPICFYAVLSLWYGIVGHRTSFLPAYLIYGAWIGLQVMRAEMEVIRDGHHHP